MEGTLTLKRTKTSKVDRMQKVLANPLLIERELNNRSFYRFFQYYWSELSSEDLVTNWHMEYLCNELQEAAERVSRKEPKLYDIVINIPPGTTKTSIVSIMFPVWCWTRWYYMQFITASHASSLSLEIATAARDIIKSPKFREMYPELEIKEDADNKSNYRVQKRVLVKGRVNKTLKGGNRYSTSIDASPIGFHAHIQIVDDPLNPKKAVSEIGLKTANHFMDQTLSTRKVDKEVTILILIMQRLHQNDPSGNKLGKKTPVKHICLPGELNEYSKYVKPAELSKHYVDGLLDPIRMSRKALINMEADLGQYGYAGQVGQNPTPPGGGMFKPDNIAIISRMPTAPEILLSVRYWDKAGSKDTGAYTVGVLMHRLKNEKLVISDVKRGQWASEEREAIIRNTAEADGTHVLIYHEQEPGSGGKQSAEQTIRNLIGFTSFADLPKGDKVYRADPYSVQVNNGQVQMVLAPWNKQFIEEHRYFPLGTYKDQVDAGSGAFSKLIGKRFARSIR